MLLVGLLCQVVVAEVTRILIHFLQRFQSHHNYPSDKITQITPKLQEIIKVKIIR